MNHNAIVRTLPVNDARNRVLAWIDRAIETIETWERRHKTRRHLAELDGLMLKDIGITHDQCFIEINKNFWEK